MRRSRKKEKQFCETKSELNFDEVGRENMYRKDKNENKIQEYILTVKIDGFLRIFARMQFRPWRLITAAIPGDTAAIPGHSGRSPVPPMTHDRQLVCFLAGSCLRSACGRSPWLRSEVNIELNFPPKLRGARSRPYRRRFFASKYSLESSRRDLHNALLCTVLQSQYFSQKSSTFFRDWII